MIYGDVIDSGVAGSGLCRRRQYAGKSGTRIWKKDTLNAYSGWSNLEGLGAVLVCGSGEGGTGLEVFWLKDLVLRRGMGVASVVQRLCFKPTRARTPRTTAKHAPHHPWNLKKKRYSELLYYTPSCHSKHT